VRRVAAVIGLMTEAAVLAYAPVVATLPPRRELRGSDRAEGIWFRCCWCGSGCRVIAEDPMRPGERTVAACDWCKRLTEIVRRTAMFA
jgi:hypothetical protein